MTAPAISVQELRRSYQSRRGLFAHTHTSTEALKGISLNVAPGEVFGLLGPNGAGKTTLVKILATILLPTSGNASVLGFDVAQQTTQVRQRIGIVFGGERGLYLRLSGRDNLLFWSYMYHLPTTKARQRATDLLELVGLKKWADERVEVYSRGMKQRLHLARGLISSPEVLLLDEPTIGLDPVAAHEIRKVVGELGARGTTVFLTTHYMAEAEALCDRVAFINEGQILLIGTPHELTRLVEEVLIVEAEVHPSEMEALCNRLSEITDVLQVERLPVDGSAGRVRVRVRQHSFPAILQVLGAHGALGVNTRALTLEDVYLKLLVGRGLHV